MGNTLIPMKHKTSSNKLVPVKGDVEHSHIYMPEEPEYYYDKNEMDILLESKADAGGFAAHIADEVRHITAEEHEKLKYPQPDEIEHLNDYLYKINYTDLNYKRAFDYFKTEPVIEMGACTAVRHNSLVGRNFDWLYNDNVSFVVHTDSASGRPATIGVASNVPGLTAEVMADLPVSDMYELIPFLIKDGVNDCGLFIESNVTPLDKGGDIISEPMIEERVELNSMMVIRYVLDHFDNATSAVEFLRDYAKIFTPQHFIDMGYAIHFMVGDRDTTYICEVWDNHLQVKNWNKSAIMANFFVNDVEFNADGSVFTPWMYESDESKDPTGVNHITGFGAGLERYNLANAAINNLNSKDDVLDLMQNLFYTNAYSETKVPRWYSEFTDHGAEITLNDFHLLENMFYVGAREFYPHRSRDPQSPYYGTWQTTHSSVYDLDACELTVRVQEELTTYTYKLTSTERTENKVTELSQGSTHTQYPSAKSVVNYVDDEIAEKIAATNEELAKHGKVYSILDVTPIDVMHKMAAGEKPVIDIAPALNYPGVLLCVYTGNSFISYSFGFETIYIPVSQDFQSWDLSGIFEESYVAEDTYNAFETEITNRVDTIEDDIDELGELTFTKVQGKDPFVLVTQPVTLENWGEWAEGTIPFTPSDVLSAMTINSHLLITINGVEYDLPLYDDDTYGDWDYSLYGYAVEFLDYDDPDVWLCVGGDFDEGVTITVSSAKILYNDTLESPEGTRVIELTQNGSFDGGIGNEVTGNFSGAVGARNTVTGNDAFTNGYNNTASGGSSYAGGSYNKATGTVSHAEGFCTEASGSYSHSEGFYTKASGYASHAEGVRTESTGQGQHVAGIGNITDNNAYYILGNGTVNRSWQVTKRSNAHTIDTRGNGWFAGDVYTGSTSGTHKDAGSKKLANQDSVDELRQMSFIKVLEEPYTIINTPTTFYNEDAWAEIEIPISVDEMYSAMGFNSHLLVTINDVDYDLQMCDYDTYGDWYYVRAPLAIEIYDYNDVMWFAVCAPPELLPDGEFTISSAILQYYPRAEAPNEATNYLIGSVSNKGDYAYGNNTYANGFNAWAFGTECTATAPQSHAEGYRASATQYAAHAEGSSTIASGSAAHAEGTQTTASQTASHAEGGRTTASGRWSHAQGYNSTASGDYSHAEGVYTTASELASHTEGCCTIANGRSQHVSGVANIADTTSLHIVGNGDATTGGTVRKRSNAYTLDRSGNAWFSGDVYTGSTSGTNKDAGSKKLAKDEDVVALQENLAKHGSIYKISEITPTEAFTKWTQGEVVIIDIGKVMYGVDSIPVLADFVEGAIFASFGNKALTIEPKTDMSDWDIEGLKFVSLVSNVQLNNTSIVDANGVATIPVAEGSNLGVVKANSAFGTQISSGALIGITRTAQQYDTASNGLLVSKGTFENIIADKVSDNLSLAVTGQSGTASAGIVRPFNRSFKDTLVSGETFLEITSPSTAAIDNRYVGGRAVTVETLDYAVKAAMTDGKKLAYTDAEKLSAQDTIGVTETVEKTNELYNLAENKLYVINKETESIVEKTIAKDEYKVNINMIGGKSIKWNQLINNEAANGTTAGVAQARTTSGFTWTGECTTSTQRNIAYVNLKNNHKYFFTMNVDGTVGPDTGDMFFQIWDSTNGIISNLTYANTVQGINTRFFTPTTLDESVISTVRFRQAKDTTYDLEVSNIMFFDLTEIYGTGNEPATKEEFQAVLTQQYYPYNAGTILHAAVNKIDVTGKNLLNLDSSWLDDSAYLELPLNIKPGSYTLSLEKALMNSISSPISGTYVAVINVSGKTSTWTTNPKAYLGNTNSSAYVSKMYKFTVTDPVSLYVGFNGASSLPANYKEVLTSFFGNMQLESGSTATNYVPYSHKEIELPASITGLDGYGWSAGPVYNEVDFENKKFIQRVGRVAYSSITFSYDSNLKVFYGNIISDKQKKALGIIFTELYANISDNTSVAAMPDKTIKGLATRNMLLYIKDLDCSDVDSFKQKHINDYIYYELAEPIITDISDILDQIDVEEYGTLKYITSNDVSINIPTTISHYVKVTNGWIPILNYTCTTAETNYTFTSPGNFTELYIEGDIKPNGDNAGNMSIYNVTEGGPNGQSSIISIPNGLATTERWLRCTTEFNGLVWLDASGVYSNTNFWTSSAPFRSLTASTRAIQKGDSLKITQLNSTAWGVGTNIKIYGR